MLLVRAAWPDHAHRRDVAAMQGGQMTRCGALTWDGRHSRHLVLTCDPAPAPAGQLALL